MSFLSKTKATYLILVILGLSFALPVTGQVKKRVITLPEWSPLYEDEEFRVELVEIRIAGRPVIPGHAFDADGDWLKQLTFRVRIIAPSPVVAFGLSGELFAGINEEPPPHASVVHGVVWGWGKGFDPRKERAKGKVIKTGAVIELGYDNVERIYRDLLAEKRAGTFCKLRLGPWNMQYKDGTVVRPLLKFVGSRGT